MTWLIDQFQGYLDARNGATHPPPSLRLQNLFRTAASKILPTDPAIAGLHADVLRQFDVVRAAIPNMYGTQDLTARISDASLMAALETFDRRFDDIKKELGDFEHSEHY